VENGDLNWKRKSGDESTLAPPFAAAAAGTGVFEGVAWPLPMAFGGAVCASKDWKPNQRASSRTFAVLA
jgi:hypothetical protein